MAYVGFRKIPFKNKVIVIIDGHPVLYVALRDWNNAKNNNKPLNLNFERWADGSDYSFISSSPDWDEKAYKPFNGPVNVDTDYAEFIHVNVLESNRQEAFSPYGYRETKETIPTLRKGIVTYECQGRQRD